MVRGVRRNKVSDFDPRTKNQVKTGGMQGGDRMKCLYHNYAKNYAKYLINYKNKRVCLAEVGILKGSGLAIWCEIFSPESKIYGLDIDLGHTKNNYSNLKKLGAFKNNEPELFVFDQFENNSIYISSFSKNSKFNIVIDDGIHTNKANIKTFKSFIPHLSNDFVYFIEDNRDVHLVLEKLYPDYNYFYEDQMTIITNKHT